MTNEEIKEKEEDYKAPVIIKINDFPSRNEIIKFFKSFIASQEGKNIQYNISNKANEINFILQNHLVAFNFMETLNRMIEKNPLYANTQTSLSFRNLQKAQSTNNLRISKKYKNVKSKLFLKNIKDNGNNNNPNNNTTIKGNDLSVSVNISAFELKHWKDIKEKAGIIDNDSPYIDDLKREINEIKENKKKWINKQDFNHYIGKASTAKKNYIKNYISLTPSLPPVLYQFRMAQKDKWINKSGFKLY